jgi:hypothetical protein
MKISKSEWQAFIADDQFWGENYMEDVLLELDGIEMSDDDDKFKNLPPNASLVVSSGAVLNSVGDYIRSIDAQIKLWRKKRQYTTIIVEVKKDALDDVKSAILSAGGKIIL